MRVKALSRDLFPELRENPGALTSRSAFFSLSCVFPRYKSIQPLDTHSRIQQTAHNWEDSALHPVTRDPLLLLTDKPPRKALYPFCR